MNRTRPAFSPTLPLLLCLLLAALATGAAAHAAVPAAERTVPIWAGVEHGKPVVDGVVVRDAHYPGAERLGRGSGYRYAHDQPGAVSDQPLLPEGLRERRFYAPTDRGFEAELGRRLEALRKRLGKS